jgi:RimJ/RimL family protein N-acetyltransferase
MRPVRLETSRLTIRPLTLDDAPAVLALLNEPSFLSFVGDRGVRTVDDARRYLETGPLAMYAAHGHGMYRVGLRADDQMIGICGLMWRAELPQPDLGFALFPGYWRQGYAFEAASVVMKYARETLGLGVVLAIAQADNHTSKRLLERLGFRAAGTARIREDEELLLFEHAHAPAGAGIPLSDTRIG